MQSWYYHTPILENIHSSDGSPGSSNHGIDNVPRVNLTRSGKFIVILNRKEGRLFAVESEVVHTSGWEEMEESVNHAISSSHDGENGKSVLEPDALERS